MSERDDGGSAFPRPYSQHDDSNRITSSYDEQDGMTLRDYFAAKAMQALLSHTPHLFEATTAWVVADAMLKERSK